MGDLQGVTCEVHDPLGDEASKLSIVLSGLKGDLNEIMSCLLGCPAL